MPEEVYSAIGLAILSQNMYHTNSVPMLKILRNCDNNRVSNPQVLNLHLQCFLPDLLPSLLISNNNFPCSWCSAHNAPHLAPSKENITPGVAYFHDSVHVPELG